MLKKLSPGAVHKLPADLKTALSGFTKAAEAWEDITPLARNEWICWVQSCAQEKTRIKRVAWAVDSLNKGKRRPCCWAGCGHREKTGK
jgi:uncharacterized protein YdeI (YjbR/CyaY-like superfamily)